MGYKESTNPLTTGIRNPSSRMKSQGGIQNPILSWITVLTLVIILTKVLRKVFLFLLLAGTPRHPVMHNCKIKSSLLHNKAISFVNITNAHGNRETLKNNGYKQRKKPGSNSSHLFISF